MFDDIIFQRIGFYIECPKCFSNDLKYDGGAAGLSPYKLPDSRYVQSETFFSYKCNNCNTSFTVQSIATWKEK